MDQGNDLIWGIGFLMHDTTDKLAKETPKQQFAIIDSVVNQPNVASVVFKEEEGSFLMGIMAAKTTKTKKVGFVGGIAGDVITHFEEGFVAGVKAVDPSVQVIPVYADSFTDSVKGKQIAVQMFAQGVDVVFHAAGGVGQGVIAAAKEQNKFAIGVDSDQNKLAPQNVISSMMKRVDVAVEDVSKAAKDGKFPGGKMTSLGLKEDGVGYSSTTLWDKMPADTKALVDKWAQAIKDGKVQVPNVKGQAAKWTAPTL
jgi:basic membrane protein A